jgi:hypothetical protein
LETIAMTTNTTRRMTHRATSIGNRPLHPAPVMMDARYLGAPYRR